MSKAYAEKFGSKKITRVEMQKFLRPKFKRDKDGNPIYLTEQSHKNQCDINRIVQRYNKTGVISHMNKIEGKYGDMSGADFKTMMDITSGVRSKFAALPAKIRNRFENEPEKLLEFFENPENRNEAIELGLVAMKTKEELDGLGEHVVDGKIVPKPVEPVVEPVVEPAVE